MRGAVAREYAASLDEAGLRCVPAGMGGPVWQVLLHVADHGPGHCAQTFRLLHNPGAPTFDQDYSFFAWRRG